MNVSNETFPLKQKTFQSFVFFQKIHNFCGMVGPIKWGCFMISMGLQRISFLLVVLALFTAGCAENNIENKDPFPTYDANSSLGRELANASLVCASKECESNKSDFESIGLVAMASEGYASTYFSYKMGQCTGFLYGSNDIVALNSHCITPAMWANRSKCNEILAIRFPETPGHPTEIRSCTELIYKSDIDDSTALNITPDYAFFRIRPVNRKYLPLATTPTGTQQLVSVRKINPSPQKEFGGRLDYARCETLTGSLLNSNYISPWSETGVAVKMANSYESCKIIPGNSGSPVLNARNEIIGLAQSYASSDFVKIFSSDIFSTEFSKQVGINIKFSMPSSVPDHFHYTQVLCVRSPTNSQYPNITCASNIPKTTSNQEEATTGFDNASSIDQYIQNLKKQSLELRPSIFDFDIVKAPDFHRYTIVPKCLVNSKKWAAADIDPTSGSPAENRQVVTAKRPMFFELHVDVRFDQNLVRTSKQLSHKSKDGRFEFTLKNNQITSLTRKKSSGLYFDQETEEQLAPVNWCL